MSLFGFIIMGCGVVGTIQEITEESGSMPLGCFLRLVTHWSLSLAVTPGRASREWMVERWLWNSPILSHVTLWSFRHKELGALSWGFHSSLSQLVLIL